MTSLYYRARCVLDITYAAPCSLYTCNVRWYKTSKFMSLSLSMPVKDDRKVRTIGYVFNYDWYLHDLALLGVFFIRDHLIMEISEIKRKDHTFVDG
jgi:hypothetical protein